MPSPAQQKAHHRYAERLPSNYRHIVVCDPDTWLRMWTWGDTHGVSGYRGRVTFAELVRALLEAAEEYRALVASLEGETASASAEAAYSPRSRS